MPRFERGLMAEGGEDLCHQPPGGPPGMVGESSVFVTPFVIAVVYSNSDKGGNVRKI